MAEKYTDIAEAGSAKSDRLRHWRGAAGIRMWKPSVQYQDKQFLGSLSDTMT